MGDCCDSIHVEPEGEGVTPRFFFDGFEHWEILPRPAVVILLGSPSKRIGRDYCKDNLVVKNRL
jgi:hypothetical protein